MAIVSVHKTHSDSYEDIKKTVDRVIADLGGLEDIIKPGYRVIIKPNLVATPTHRLSGGITRWEVCMAIYEQVQALGAVPILAESSACGVNTEDVIRKCGYQDLRDQGIHQTEITLGMKNCKGLIADVQKKDFHARGLVDSVCDLVATIKPCLEIIDGTYGQQGLGPIYGETKKMDLIIGSKDLVACETVAGKIMGYEPEEVMLTRAAYERGLGEMDIDRIEVAGRQIDEVKSRFKRTSEVEVEGLPKSCRLIFDYQACTGCHNTVISSLMDMKAQDYSSNTNYLIMVDKSTYTVCIYKGKKGSWLRIKGEWPCTHGGSLTPEGEKTIVGRLTKRSETYGWADFQYSSAAFTMELSSGNFMHSVLFEKGTRGNPYDHWIMDPDMYRNYSKGCIRLQLPNAEWVWDNIPKGTKVVVYRSK